MHNHITSTNSVEQHDPAALLAFWRAAGPKRWFAKDDAFDAEFGSRFRQAHFAAARRELDAWSDQPEPALALLLLLDQYPRNSFRGTAHMYATDPLARHFADRLIDQGFDAPLEPALRAFCYLPFMHSEALKDQERSLLLNRALDDNTQRFARLHHDIIARFGRFPHRNTQLGRATTPEEQAFLDEGGFSG